MLNTVRGWLATLAVLASATGLLGASANDAPPRIADPLDGHVVAVEGDVLYFLWDGGRQRIQQPAAMTDADLQRLGLRVGPPIDTELAIGKQGSRFVLYPADDPQPMLYLLDDTTLHSVNVTVTTHAAVADRPDLEALVITRVRRA